MVSYLMLRHSNIKYTLRVQYFLDCRTSHLLSFLEFYHSFVRSDRFNHGRLPPSARPRQRAVSGSYRVKQINILLSDSVQSYLFIFPSPPRLNRFKNDLLMWRNLALLLLRILFPILSLSSHVLDVWQRRREGRVRSAVLQRNLLQVAPYSDAPSLGPVLNQAPGLDPRGPDSPGLHHLYRREANKVPVLLSSVCYNPP